MKKYFSVADWPSTKTVKKKQGDQVSEGKRFGNWQINEEVVAKASDHVITVKQVHGGNIVKDVLVNNQSEADGIFLTDKNLVVGVVTADCAPVIIMTEDKALALHVSRKSIVHGLLENVLSYIEPKEIDKIYVGPHICEYHLSFTKEEFALRRFRLRFGRATHWHQGQIYVSLNKALQKYFTAWEIHPNKIYYDGRCTYEMLSLPSYRRALDSGEDSQGRRLLTTVSRGD